MKTTQTNPIQDNGPLPDNVVHVDFKAKEKLTINGSVRIKKVYLMKI